MELRIEKYQLPEQVNFNYEELKNELLEKIEVYQTLVYTDEQIKLAKSDKANLNKLKKALNDERIRLQKEYMKPFDDFKSKIDELINIINTPVNMIDSQIKEFDEMQKNKKREEIERMFSEMNVSEWLNLDMIFNQKWLNTTVSMKSINQELSEILNKIETDLTTLSNLPEFAFESIEVYKTTLDINKAIQEGSRLLEIQQRKLEQERLQQEQQQEQQKKPYIKPQLIEESQQHINRVWLGFKAYLTVSDAQALADFFTNRGISYEKIDI